MTDLLGNARKVAACKFNWQKDERTYDYWIPHGLDLAVGDRAVVETKRGEAKVMVMAIHDGPGRAEKEILRKHVEEASPPAAEMDF